MSIEIKVPSIGESINEVTLTKWIKNDGDWVERDEVIAELESEKATFEINAELAGILHTIAKENDTLNIGDVACTIDDKAEKPAEAKKEPAAKEDTKKGKSVATTATESASDKEA
ncbi:MAG: biotin/lipoyl-containing protein, partial [Ginsengibacter sp.]